MGAIEDLKRALGPARGDVLGVLLWGSHARGSATERSDIDICVVSGPGVDPDEALRAMWTKARLVGPDHDVKVFEDLPLYLQGEAIEHGLVVLSRDEPALWEYLRRFRKVWDDQSVRRLGREELARLVEARRRRAEA